MPWRGRGYLPLAGEYREALPVRSKVEDRVEILAPPLGRARPATVWMFRHDESVDARPGGAGQIGLVGEPVRRFEVT